MPQEHRDAFIAAIRDPDSEAGRELLESAQEGDEEGPALPGVLPWWESSGIHDELDEDEDELEYAEGPEMVSEQVMMGITPPDGVGRKLVYNALAVWYVLILFLIGNILTDSIAYLHTLLSFRLPSLDQIYLNESGIEIAEIKSEISRLVPFLVDQKSIIRYSNAREAYSSIWEGLGADQVRLIP